MIKLGETPSSPTSVDPTPTEITVACVPAAHVYVRHIASESGDGVIRLPDPDPDRPDRSAEQRWWPPVMLHPDWITSHEFDVFHIQFGFDAWSPDELLRVVQAVHARGRTVAYTAHDLRNPHHPARSRHDAQLDVLMAHADAVITLTEGAASEIQDRWHRGARVLPHPHVVDFDTMSTVAAARPSVRTPPFRVGLHLKSLRASMDPLTVLPTLVRSVAGLPDAVLQVNGHCDVLCRGGAKYDAQLASYLRRAEGRGELELHVHDFLPDAELWRYLASLDVSVLAYRFGTHSGWLEACRDLGTTVVAPTCGYYADQGPVHSYVLDEKQFDPDSLTAAVHAAHAAGPVAPVPVAARRDQRARIAAAHRRLYESLT